ncbi:MAG: TIGR03808 family TAT-translocated repetitive protein, partial [Pseudomonadota bacterium]
IEGAPRFGMLLGWGPYMRNIAASQNILRDCGTGIAVTVVDGAGPAAITNNIVQGSKLGAIKGYRWLEPATGELNNASRYANLTVTGNQVSA